MSNITLATKTSRNDLIAWVSVYEGQSEIGYVQLAPDISDEDLQRAERHVLSLCYTIFHRGHSRGVDQVRKGVKEALGL